MTINQYHAGIALAIGRCCLVVELFWVFPWFFGTYEALDDHAKLGTILFGSALLIGVIVASIAAAFDGLNIKTVALASGGVLFGASVIAVYASIFAITVVERACIVAIGISWLVLLVSINYMIPDSSLEKNASVGRLNEFHVPEIGAAAAFTVLNAWFIDSSWTFRYVGVAVVAGFLIAAIFHANDLRVRDIKAAPATSKRQTLESFLLGIHGLLLLVAGALAGLAVAAQIRSNSLGSSALQASESQLFIDSGLAIALVAVSLVIILTFMGKTVQEKITRKRFSFQQITPVFIILISMACLAGVASLFMELDTTGYMNVPAWLAMAGILSALFLESMIVMARMTRKMFVSLVIGSALMVAGVLFVPTLQYPQGWLILKEIMVPGTLIPVAIGICWIIIARPWKGTFTNDGPVNEQPSSMGVPST